MLVKEPTRRRNPKPEKQQSNIPNVHINGPFNNGGMPATEKAQPISEFQASKEAGRSRFIILDESNQWELNLSPREITGDQFIG